MLMRFLRQSPARRLLLIEAAGWLCLARLSILLLPFRRVAQLWFGETVSAEDLPPAPRAVPIAESVGWAIACAARNLPLETLCLPQAMAARAMLRRRGVAVRLHLGVRRGGPRALKAHAWLDAAGRDVTGSRGASDFVKLASFT